MGRNQSTRASGWRAVLPPLAEGVVLCGTAVTIVTTAAIGAHLIDRSGRERGAVEASLEARHRLAAVEGTVANLEADRRAYQLTGMPVHLATLQQDHERAHAEVTALREAVDTWPAMLQHVGSAESLIGTWRVEAAGALSGRTTLGLDRAFLGAARAHLDAVSAGLDAELRGARADAARAHEEARKLWLAAAALSLVVIGGLTGLAARRRSHLHRQTREIERLLEALPFAVLSLDVAGNVRHATGQATLLAGAWPSLNGRTLTDVIATLDRPSLEQAVVRARAGAIVTCEAQVMAEYDAARSLAFSLAPIVHHGRTIGLSAVVRDVTSERALRTQSRETERLARLGTMAAGVAHELNGALTVILGATRELDRLSLDGAEHAAVAVVQAEAARAARTVRIILDFSRRDAHHHDPQTIGDILERAVGLRRFDPRSREVDFQLHVETGLPLVLGDAQELLQVFLNILANAEQAVQGQPVRAVEVEARAEAHRVVIAVTDSGPGIPDDHLERVFSPFYTTKPRGEGTGLGLALARGVVVEHQGTIRAERGPRGGARIVVELPALDAGAIGVHQLSTAASTSRSQPRRIAAAG